MAHTPIDWNPIRHDFVTGIFKEGNRFVQPTYAIIAKKWSVDRDSVAKKARSEGWIAQRESHFNEIYEAAMDQKKQELSSQSAQFDTEMFLFARYASKILGDRMLEKKRKKDPQTGKYYQDVEINTNIPTLELKRLTEIAKSLQDVKEGAVGDIAETKDNSLGELVGILKDMQETGG